MHFSKQCCRQRVSADVSKITVARKGKLLAHSRVFPFFIAFSRNPREKKINYNINDIEKDIEQNLINPIKFSFTANFHNGNCAISKNLFTKIQWKEDLFVGEDIEFRERIQQAFPESTLLIQAKLIFYETCSLSESIGKGKLIDKRFLLKIKKNFEKALKKSE